jgi:hypothetical protein
MGATTVVYFLRTPEASAIESAGPAHPEFGRLFDIGTYARLTGFEGAGADLAGVLAEEADGRFALEKIAWDTGPAPRETLAALDQAAETGNVFVVVSGPAGGPAFLVAAGSGLPSMGRAEDADAQTLRCSLRFALGVGELTGSVFAEPPFDGEAEEARLRERLRQLYGED